MLEVPPTSLDGHVFPINCYLIVIYALQVLHNPLRYSDQDAGKEKDT